MSTQILKMEIVANPEYISIIRLTLSGIANSIGFCIEDIEDMKVAVSEACTNVIRHSDDDKICIIFEKAENGLTTIIEDNGKGYNLDSIKKPDLLNPKENGLGIFIIKTLMDDVYIESKENKGTFIKMTKYMGADI